GDKVRYVGEDTYGFMTIGNMYEVVPTEDGFDAFEFYTTTDNEDSCSWDESEYGDFELVTEDTLEPQPDVHALLANIARRLSEVEAAQERDKFEAVVDDFEEAVADLSDDNDVVNSPSHYTQGAIEVIDYIDQVAEGYEGKQAVYVANVIKYVSRAPYKN